MNELDELKSLWQDQHRPTDLKSVDTKKAGGLADQIDRYKRKIYLSNLISTVGMSVVITYLGFIMVNYPDQKPLFYLSIVAVMLLSVTVVVILWSRRLKAGSDLMLSSTEYAAYQIKKLKRTRMMIEYSPLYGLVLGIMVSLYAYSLIEEASGEFVFWMTNANWIYIILITFISHQYKIRKFRKEAQPIMDQLSEFLKE